MSFGLKSQETLYQLTELPRQHPRSEPADRCLDGHEGCTPLYTVPVGSQHSDGKPEAWPLWGSVSTLPAWPWAWKKSLLQVQHGGAPHLCLSRAHKR